MHVLKKNQQYLDSLWSSNTVRQEMNKSLALLKKVDKPIISFFGGANVKEGSKEYKKAFMLGKRLAEKGFAVMSGGGPGIMRAANSGAISARGISLGFKAELLQKERIHDKIFTHELFFKFMFVRRFAMAIKSDALIFFPGGMGTFDELFEYTMLVQTGIVDRVPIILVGKSFWQGLFDWLKQQPLKKGYFKNEGLKILTLVDSPQEALKIIERL